MTDYSEFRWMSCSKEMGGISAHRHLAVPGQLTTVCGATASHADIWRTNTTKPNCPLCSGSEKGKQIIGYQIDQLLNPLPAQVLVCTYCTSLQGQKHAGFCLTRMEGAREEWVTADHVGLPRKVVFSVNVSVHLVEEKPTEVSVIPVGQMSRATAKDLAWTAINQLGFRDVQLESNGFSEHGAFFEVKC